MEHLHIPHIVFIPTQVVAFIVPIDDFILSSSGEGVTTNDILYSQLLQQALNASMQEHQTPVKNSLSQDLIDKIETIAEEQVPCEDCSICTDPMKNGGGVVVKLPCGHFFHKGCVSYWFKESRQCPLCRFEITKQSLRRRSQCALSKIHCCWSDDADKDFVELNPCGHILHKECLAATTRIQNSSSSGESNSIRCWICRKEATAGSTTETDEESLGIIPEPLD